MLRDSSIRLNFTSQGTTVRDTGDDPSIRVKAVKAVKGCAAGRVFEILNLFSHNRLRILACPVLGAQVLSLTSY